jgi:hypothetical protein
MSLTISTVNVLECQEGVPANIVSFNDNKKGNKAAEAMFTTIAKEHGVKEKNIPSYIEDGVYENGTYGVFLIHS